MLFLTASFFWCFLLFQYYLGWKWDYIWVLMLDFSYQEETEASCFYTTFWMDSCVLLWHCVAPFIHQNVVSLCCGSSVLKALPTCLYVGWSGWVDRPKMSIWVVLSLPWQFISFCGTWQYILTGQGHLGLGALSPPPPIQTSPHVAPCQSIICNRRYSIFYMSSSIKPVECCIQKPIFGFRSLYRWTRHESFCWILSVHLGFLPHLIQCKDVGLLNGTPQFFLHGSFCMKIKAPSIHNSSVKSKKVCSCKKLVFHCPLTQRNLSFAIIVICSTFVNTIFS